MAPKNRQSNATVLLIEDEPALVEIYTLQFARAGFRVLSEQNGIAGLASAIEHKPDVVLLDVMLPGKDGFQVLRDLKANTATEHIPVLILSNLGQKYEVDRGKRLGAARFITKVDFTPQRIVEITQDVLEESKKTT